MEKKNIPFSNYSDFLKSGMWTLMGVSKRLFLFMEEFNLNYKFELNSLSFNSFTFSILNDNMENVFSFKAEKCFRKIVPVGPYLQYIHLYGMQAFTYTIGDEEITFEELNSKLKNLELELKYSQKINYYYGYIHTGELIFPQKYLKKLGYI